MQRYADRARFGLVTSAWNSIIVFGLIGAADSLIIMRFKLKGTLFSYLLIFVTIANPVVCESLTYSYMSVNFGLAYCFSVLAFALIPAGKETRKEIIFRLILSATAFGVSMAFYQAYICVYAVLCMYFILKMLKRGNPFPEVVKKIVLCAAIFFFGGIFYYFITRLLLWRSNVELASYRGANDINIIEIIKNFPAGMITAYKETLNYIFVNRLNAKLEFSNSVFIIMGVIFIVFTVISLVDIFRKNKKSAVLSAGVVMLLPVASSVVCIIAVGNSISGLMAMGILMTVLLFYTFVDYKKVMRGIMNCLVIIVAWYLVSAVENDQIALKEGMKATERIAESIISEITADDLLENADCVAFVGRAAENPLFYKSMAYELANGYAQFGK